MKRIKLWVGLALTAFILSSCACSKTMGSGKVPPGQAKKVTGSQSAKPYAPGQQNK